MANSSSAANETSKNLQALEDDARDQMQKAMTEAEEAASEVMFSTSKYERAKIDAKHAQENAEGLLRTTSNANATLMAYYKLFLASSSPPVGDPFVLSLAHKDALEQLFAAMYPVQETRKCQKAANKIAQAAQNNLETAKQKVESAIDKYSRTVQDCVGSKQELQKAEELFQGEIENLNAKKAIMDTNSELNPGVDKPGVGQGQKRKKATTTKKAKRDVQEAKRDVQKRDVKKARKSARDDAKKETNKGTKKKSKTN